MPTKSSDKRLRKYANLAAAAALPRGGRRGLDGRALRDAEANREFYSCSANHSRNATGPRRPQREHTPALGKLRRNSRSRRTLEKRRCRNRVAFRRVLADATPP